MFETMMNRVNNIADICSQKLCQCESCGRLEAPFLYNANIVKNFGWKNTSTGWICARCQVDAPKSDEELMERMDENRHHNLVIKNRVLRSKYGWRYRRVLC